MTGEDASNLARTAPDIAVQGDFKPCIPIKFDIYILINLPFMYIDAISIFLLVLIP